MKQTIIQSEPALANANGCLEITHATFYEAVLSKHQCKFYISDHMVWPTYELEDSLDQSVDTRVYALVTRRPIHLVEPSWVMDFPHGGVFYGFILKEPLSWEAWSAFPLPYDVFLTQTPAAEHDGVFAPYTVWRPDRSCTLEELCDAWIFMEPPTVSAIKK
jgi:hypothetical protein